MHYNHMLCLQPEVGLFDSRRPLIRRPSLFARQHFSFGVTTKAATRRPMCATRLVRGEQGKPGVFAGWKSPNRDSVNGKNGGRSFFSEDQC